MCIRDRCLHLLVKIHNTKNLYFYCVISVYFNGTDFSNCKDSNVISLNFFFLADSTKSLTDQVLDTPLLTRILPFNGCVTKC